LDGEVKQAYQFLCQAYQPNDEIYLLGVSRGAYTARSVAGIIRKCGIIDDPTPERINEALNYIVAMAPRIALMSHTS
jgi:uncharacterized protein (DUF2235 family)